MWRANPWNCQPWSAIRRRWTNRIRRRGTRSSRTVVAIAQVAPASREIPRWVPRRPSLIRRWTTLVRYQNSTADRCAAV